MTAPAPQSQQTTVDAIAKTIWLAEFGRAFSRAPSDPWENQADSTKEGHLNTARKLVEAGLCCASGDVRAAVIERCAKVADRAAVEMDELQNHDLVSRHEAPRQAACITANAAREIATAIRALSQSPATDAAARTMVVGRVTGKLYEGDQCSGMSHAICHACGIGYKCFNLDCPNDKPNPALGNSNAVGIA